jgi:3-oxoacyl-[acyl-carrier protein] reductase
MRMPGFAAVAAINAAFNSLAKAFADQGVKDGVQVNSVSPGGRRRSVFEKRAPLHNLTVGEAIKIFPQEAGITRFAKPEEIADWMSDFVSPTAGSRGFGPVPSWPPTRLRFSTAPPVNLR